MVGKLLFPFSELKMDILIDIYALLEIVAKLAVNSTVEILIHIEVVTCPLRMQ